MKRLIKKNILVSSAVVAGMLLTTTFGVSNVHADSVDNSNTTQVTSIPDKSLISPVASKDNQTLRQVAQSNDVSLDVLEQLNDNIDPDQPIKNGTPLYLPGNVDYSNLFSVFAVDNKVPSSLYKKYYANLSSSERAAKLWIIHKESNGDYHARNGKYIGRFQLTNTYLKGDYSKTNQERTAARYVKTRYGSWVAAKRFWQANGWY